MKKIIMTTIIMSASAFSFATAPTQMSLGDALLSKKVQLPADNPCSRVSLRDDQKGRLKQVMYDAAQSRIQDEANIKKAMLASFHTLSSATSTREEGQKAQDDTMAAFTTYGNNMSALEMTIIYDILQPEQREDAMLCSLFMKKHSKKDD